METYLYLSLTPEALVLSMLPPRDFGTYLATGTQKRSREQAIYLQLTGELDSDYFDLKGAHDNCVPHPDGQPKHSVYVSIYRVLEHIPLQALGSLWLATRDGRVLELTQQPLPSQFQGTYHLYQELCPVHPLIASRLDPPQFCRFITDPAVRISVPTICFAELDLAGLAEDPVSGHCENLPYKDIDHLKDCLKQLASAAKTTKTVNRIQSEHVLYRCIKTGFFIGNQDRILYYPYPSAEQMETEHHDWWRSATLG